MIPKSTYPAAAAPTRARVRESFESVGQGKPTPQTHVTTPVISTLAAAESPPIGAPSPALPPRPAVYDAWEKTAGPLTGQIADELKDAVGEFGEAFVIAGIEEMGKSGARNLKYLRRILDDCQRDGRMPGQPRATRPPGAQQAAKRAATPDDPDNWAGKASGLDRPAPMRSAVPPGWKPAQKEKAS